MKHRAQFTNLSVHLAVMLTLSAVPAVASISYNITIDTTTLSGIDGFLDMQYDPGVDSQSGFAAISMFTSDGTVGVEQAPLGNVTGTLPATVTIVNDPGINDYFTGMDFGTTLSFVLTLGGNVIESPNNSPDGSTFYFSMIGADESTPLLTTNPQGFAFEVNVNPDGTTSVNDFITSGNTITLNVTPEPGSIGLMLFGTALLAARARAWARRR
jgi:hypothetical protein